MAKRQKLGEMLIAAGVIDAMQLQSALGYQRQWGVPLGRALLEKRLCTEDQILAALSKQSGLVTIEIDLGKLDKSLASILPQRIAEQHRAIPLRLEGARGDVLVVALGGPANLASVDEVRSASGKARVVPYLAKDTDIDRAIDVLYRGFEIPVNVPPQPGVTYDGLPPEGLYQAEESFDFGDDRSELLLSADDANSLDPQPPQAVNAERSGADLLDELMGGISSEASLQRSAPPSTPPATAVDPVAAAARPNPVEAPANLVRPPPLPSALGRMRAPAPQGMQAPGLPSGGQPGPVSEPGSPEPRPPSGSARAPLPGDEGSRPADGRSGGRAEVEASSGNTPPVPGRPVIIYGWPPQAAALLQATLSGSGIASRAVETSAPLVTTEDDIVVAPLPLIEAIVAGRKAPLPGNVIVAVKTPESDLHRAQRVSAKGYLATPVDGELLLRAIRRCVKR